MQNLFSNKQYINKLKNNLFMSIIDSVGKKTKENIKWVTIKNTFDNQGVFNGYS